MTSHQMSAQSANGGYFSEELCDIEEFKALTSRTTNPGMAPSASVIEKNVPLYDAPDI